MTRGSTYEARATVGVLPSSAATSFIVVDTAFLRLPRVRICSGRSVDRPYDGSRSA